VVREPRGEGAAGAAPRAGVEFPGEPDDSSAGGVARRAEAVVVHAPHGPTEAAPQYVDAGQHIRIGQGTGRALRPALEFDARDRGLRDAPRRAAVRGDLDGIGPD